MRGHEERNSARSQLINGADDPLAPYVREAAAQWKFRPATLHDQPVDVIYHLSTSIHVR
jgi:hypothetical protein